MKKLWVEIRGFRRFLFLFGLFRTAIADWNPIPSGSMRPSLLEGDVVLVNRLAYDLKVPLTKLSLARLGEPQRGDIVARHHADDVIHLEDGVRGALQLHLGAGVLGEHHAVAAGEGGGAAVVDNVALVGALLGGGGEQNAGGGLLLGVNALDEHTVAQGGDGADLHVGGWRGRGHQRAGGGPGRQAMAGNSYPK